MWKCSKCQEKNDESFGSCWKCGTLKDGVADPTFQNAVDDIKNEPEAETTTAPLEEIPDEEAPSVIPNAALCCPKCSSHDVIPGVRIVDRGDGNARRDLQVEVYESPDALIFKGTHQGTLTASICGKCGYAELYVSNAEELFDVYKNCKRS
jgi:hypothetical protein